MCVKSLLYTQTLSPNTHARKESYVPDKIQNIHVSLHSVYDLALQPANKNSPPFNLTSPKDTMREVCVCV